MSICHAFSANIKGKSIIKNRLLLCKAEFFSVKDVDNLITKILLDHIHVKAFKR
jgi:hypothetical protein